MLGTQIFQHKKDTNVKSNKLSKTYNLLLVVFLLKICHFLNYAIDFLWLSPVFLLTSVLFLFQNPI